MPNLNFLSEFRRR